MYRFARVGGNISRVVEETISQQTAELSPPADAPRDVASRLIRKRAWTEPRVRLWWVLGIAIAVLMTYLFATQAANWWAQRRLLNRGTVVQAIIIEAKTDLNDITVPGKSMAPDSTCVMRFEISGKQYEVMGQLPEHIERGEHIVTGPEKPVTLHVDPNDPTQWTDRTTSPPFLSRQMIGVAIGAPIAIVLIVAAVLKRRGVLRVWRDGQAAPALVVGTSQTPVAPRCRVVRCTPADSADKRVFTVYLPAEARHISSGDFVWVVHRNGKPEPCYAAAWFDRAVLLCLVCLLISGCAAKPKNSANGDCCPSTPAPADFVAVAKAPMTTKPSTRPTFTGTLRGGIMAVGSETTGWALETDDGKRIDVNVDKAADAAASLDGKRVTVTGSMTTAKWLERGEKPLLMAEHIEAAK